MRAAVFHAFGDPSKVLKVAEHPVPEPRAGEVRLKMALAAIHNHDLLMVAGTYGYKPELPASAGSEAVGEIDKVGDGVVGVKVGQRVSVAGVRGAWAEYFVAEAQSVVPVPDAISDETAAQLISMPLSALLVLKDLGMKPGQWMIQNGANGAVGKVLAMAARQQGINVVNIVRRPEVVDEMHDLGIGHVVSSSSKDWKQAVAALVGDAPIVAALDSVGGKSSGELLSLVAENGTLLVFGAMSGQPIQVSSSDLIYRQTNVRGFWLSKLLRSMPAVEKSAIIDDLVGYLANGSIKLQVGQIFNLAEIVQAAVANGRAGKTGKILLRP